MNYLNPYYYFADNDNDVINEDEEEMENLEDISDNTEIGRLLIQRGYIRPNTLYAQQIVNKDYDPGAQLEIGAEGQVGITLNQQLLQEYIQRLQDLDTNRKIINQRIESQLNRQIDMNNRSIDDINENIPQQSDDLIQLNMLNQQKVQLLLLNIEYQEKIIYNVIQSDTTRIEEINGILNTMNRINSSLLDSLSEIVDDELRNLQLQITENEEILNDLTLQKRNLRQDLENLQVEFELLMQEKIKQEEEERRRFFTDSRKRLIEDGEYNSSLKKSKY